LGLGAFLFSACFFAVLLEHPASPVRAAIPSALERRALMGLAMGLTAILLIYSPPGKRSGAHLNPSVTLAFLRLGRLPLWDAALYGGADRGRPSRDRACSLRARYLASFGGALRRDQPRARGPRRRVRRGALHLRHPHGSGPAHRRVAARAAHRACCRGVACGVAGRLRRAV